MTSILFSQYPRHARALASSSIMLNSRIRDSLRLANENLTANPEFPNMDILSEPFFIAFDIDREKYQFISIDYFGTLFSSASVIQFPSQTLTTNVFEHLFNVTPSANEECRMKCCKVISSCFLCPSGFLYVHSDLLYKLFSFLISFHNISAEMKTVSEVIEMTIHEIMRIQIGAYGSSIPLFGFPTIEMLSEYITFTLVSHSLDIIKFIPKHAEFATINDVDIVVIIHALTKALESHSFHEKTIELCLFVMTSILNSSFSMFSKPFFESILKSDVHIILLAATFDSHLSLVSTTAQLLLTVWKKFSNIYLEGLNEVLDIGLSIPLSSPDYKTVRRACRVMRSMASTPQLFVDAFVNYDCDDSGYFKNIFENSMNLVIKKSYPNQGMAALQSSALHTLVQILENLWDYFKLMDQEQEKVSLEDTNPVIEAKKAKDIFVQGLDVFKKSSSKGIKFFLENGIVQNDPVSIGQFLYSTPQLDPAGVGSSIGEGKPQNIEYLKSYVNCFDFSNMFFEVAFRNFLSKFIIPGESQQIDRILEQFGLKFHNDNPGLFSCADTVYVLAYSALMLHTDAHHPNITKHMTLDEFIRNNLGIDGGKDLPYDFITALYKGITKEKIFVAPSVMPNSSLLTREQRADLFKQQCQSTLLKARERTVLPNSQRRFQRTESPLLVGPMLNSVWGGVLAVLSISLESSDDERITSLCLRGLSAALHIASHSYIEDVLKTLVDAFASLSRMRFRSDILKEKNILCTKALIHCVIQDINHLKGAWSIFLEELSAMENMKDIPIVNECLLLGENVFPETSKLDRESIIDFVKALCAISEREIESNPPRLYSLQRLGDVAHWNIDRPKFIWKEIWDIIGQHLIYVGSSNNQVITEASIDLIRQLAVKYLQKPEIAAFHFQQHFLMPFFEIFNSQGSTSIRQLILDCAVRIINESHSVLQSGWTVIFQLLVRTSHDEELIFRGFQIAEHIIVNYLEDMKHFTLHFMPVLSSFVLNDKTSSVAFSGITFFSIISSVIEKDHSDQWIGIFQALLKCSQHNDVEIKQLSCETILEICLKYGCVLSLFDNNSWTYILTKCFSSIIQLTDDPSLLRIRSLIMKNIYEQILIPFSHDLIGYSQLIIGFSLQHCQSNSLDIAAIAINSLSMYLTKELSNIPAEVIKSFNNTNNILKKFFSDDKLQKDAKNIEKLLNSP